MTAELRLWQLFYYFLQVLRAPDAYAHLRANVWCSTEMNTKLHPAELEQQCCKETCLEPLVKPDVALRWLVVVFELIERCA